MSYLALLKLAAPETIVAVTALAVIALDLLTLRDLPWQERSKILTIAAGAGCLIAIGWMLALPEHGSALGGMLVVEPVRQYVKAGLLVLAILTLLLSSATPFTQHLGEYVALLLMATIGMMFLVSSDDLLLLFVSLELTSLSLYSLTGFLKDNLGSAEAALKYFLFGGISAAFTLFGLSLVYGLSGSTNLDRIAAFITARALDPLLLLAIVMVAVGFAFKVAAAPFHLWAPDVYQGAPTPSAAFIASGSKVAGFFVLARVMAAGFAGAEGSAGWHTFKPGWLPLIAIMAAASMFLGNIAALAQTSIRRLLAYSAIAHAGYMLLGVMSAPRHGLSALLYYVLTYALSTLGAFGVVAVVQEHSGSDRISDFAGLSRRSPVVSFCMVIFILSLAGIPPLAGFFAKFYIFAAALSSGPQGSLLWLIILALVLSAVSLYYYLQVLKQIYIVAPAGEIRAIRAPAMTLIVLILLATAVLILGCLPELLLAPFAAATQAPQD